MPNTHVLQENIVDLLVFVLVGACVTINMTYLYLHSSPVCDQILKVGGLHFTVGSTASCWNAIVAIKGCLN